jgi:hypothetical protein
MGNIRAHGLSFGAHRGAVADAEGRKYGRFLILVSQRPDKLGPLVLSECETKLL